MKRRKQGLIKLHAVPRHRLDILSPLELSVQAIDPLHILRTATTDPQDGSHYHGCRGLGDNMRRRVHGRPARCWHPRRALCYGRSGPRCCGRRAEMGGIRCPTGCIELRLRYCRLCAPFEVAVGAANAKSQAQDPAVVYFYSWVHVSHTPPTTLHATQILTNICSACVLSLLRILAWKLPGFIGQAPTDTYIRRDAFEVLYPIEITFGILGACLPMLRPICHRKEYPSRSSGNNSYSMGPVRNGGSRTALTQDSVYGNPHSIHSKRPSVGQDEEEAVW